MTTVKATFICPSCGAGLNTDDQKRPEKCPNCSYKFGQVKSNSYRLPKTFFHQFRDVTRARIDAIPPMPLSEDVAEVNLPDARQRYMGAQKATIMGEAVKELSDFVATIPDEYVVDVVNSFEFMVELMPRLTPKVRAYLTAKLAHMSKVANNVTEGFTLGVRYGTTETEPLSGSSDIVDPGTRGVPTAPGGN